MASKLQAVHISTSSLAYHNMHVAYLEPCAKYASSKRMKIMRMEMTSLSQASGTLRLPLSSIVPSFLILILRLYHSFLSVSLPSNFFFNLSVFKLVLNPTVDLSWSISRPLTNMYVSSIMFQGWGWTPSPHGDFPVALIIIQRPCGWTIVGTEDTESCSTFLRQECRTWPMWIS